MRLIDLPPKVRAQVDAQLGPQRPRKSRAGVGLSAPCPGRCGCGERFPTAAKWERHVDRDHGGHGRWDIDLPEYDPDTTSAARTPRRPVR